jgi:hypothetical protein
MGFLTRTASPSHGRLQSQIPGLQALDQIAAIFAASDADDSRCVESVAEMHPLPEFKQISANLCNFFWRMLRA